MRYLEVAQSIRERIGLGQLGPGGALESENELASRYLVSRMTLRKALDRLRDEGLIVARRGSGWFAAVDPLRQALGRFATIEAVLAEAGVSWERRVLDFRFVQAEFEVSNALGIPEREEVLKVKRLNLADGEPLGVISVWLPATIGHELSRADVERTTFYDLLPLHNVYPRSALQTISAAAATPDDARLLQVDKGGPMLVCHRITRDDAGRPVILAEHRYAARKTVFEVEFPSVTGSVAEAPSGLRLLKDAS